MIGFALVLALACSAALAAIDRPCNGPDSFTGRFRRIDRERKYYVEGKMFYDHVNRQVRELEFEDVDGTKEAFDKLKLYNLNVEYTVDLRTRKCNVTVPRPFRPYGVPPDARFVGEGTIGAVGVPNEEVTLAMFEGEFDGTDPFFVSVTDPDCFPTQFGVYSNTSGSFFHAEFFDIVSGISDPNAFVIPRACVQPPQ